MKIIPVILSGGSGTRLWPLSRKQYPKQYLSLIGSNTMFQDTILRLDGLKNIANPIIICNRDHRFLVAEQLKHIGVKDATILLEPVGRNTAAAISAAALQSIKQSDDHSLLLVLAADHVIQDIQAFHKAINTATKHAKLGRIVTFGIVPSDANTEYGYIKTSSENNDGAYKVEEFVEKPNLQTAQLYIQKNNYLWNGGMFMFKDRVFIDELNTYSSNIIKYVKDSIDNAVQDLDYIRLEEDSFKLCNSVSVDYALMEKSNNVVVVPLDARWSDLGSWSALFDIGVKDKHGNVIQGDVHTEETTNTYINANHHIVATVGVKDLVIVDTPNATLISSKDKTQKVKKIVEQLQSQDRKEQSCNRKVYRPWGWFDSVESGENFQVKKLHVNTGAKLSLQMHHKRAEHWVVVSGVATIIKGKDVFTLETGDSIYIPVGTKHSLENKSSEVLEVIEVQSGSYLGEDDIVRFEDIYGRV